MKIQKVKITEVKRNTDNPRIIKDDKFNKLVNSIKEFPKMLEIRPIVVNEKMIVLGGNMRLKACKEAGLKEVFIIKAEDLTEEQQKEFIVKDNVGFGEWDFEHLANEWDSEKLQDWGLDIPEFEIEGNTDEDAKNQEYSTKIDSPNYETKNEKPKISELYDFSKTEQLIKEIEDSSVNDDVKKLLIVSAQRHIVFNYKNIADYYAHSDKNTQELMEKSALVIIDFDKAIENGYVKLTEGIKELYEEEL
jgi:hypothetical protein